MGLACRHIFSIATKLCLKEDLIIINKKCRIIDDLNDLYCRKSLEKQFNEFNIKGKFVYI